MSKKTGIFKHIRKTLIVAKAIIPCIQLLNSKLECKELNKSKGLMPLHGEGNGRRRMKRSMRYM